LQAKQEKQSDIKLTFSNISPAAMILIGVSVQVQTSDAEVIIMGWLQRLFGQQSAPSTAPTATATAPQGPTPPERCGINGEYDQSGLAKRVAKAFDDDAAIDDHGTLWVAQTGTTVVLKGKVHNQEILKKMVTVARTCKGATAVDTSEVQVI
jgi:osmotically-inducible protein OsmY